MPDPHVDSRPEPPVPNPNPYPEPVSRGGPPHPEAPPDEDVHLDHMPVSALTDPDDTKGG